jgi:hypothetical protein
MDKSRKCYRLIGDVLVERTVAETLPAGGHEGLKEWVGGGARQWTAVALDQRAL